MVAWLRGALTTFSVTWWLIGDASTVSAAQGAPCVGPYRVSPVIEVLVASVGAIGLVFSIQNLRSLSPAGMMDRRLLAVVSLTASVGVVLAISWRIETATVDGSNIGAGFVILFAPFLIAALAATGYRTHRVWSRAQARISFATLPLGACIFVAHFALLALLSSIE